MRAGRALMVTGALLLVGAACGGNDRGGDTAGGEFCSRARTAETLGDEINALLGSGDPSPADLEAKIGEYLDLAGELGRAAPDEISGELAALTDGQQRLADLLAAGGWDLGAVDSEAFIDLTSAESVTQARTAVDAYLERECGIARDTAGAAQGTTTTAAGTDTVPSDLGAFAAEIGASFAASLGVQLDEAEKVCAGQATLDTFSTGRLLELAASGADPTDAEVLAVLKGIEPCVDPAALTAAVAERAFGATPGLTEEQRTCLASGLLDELGLAGFGELGLAGGAAGQLDALLEGLAAACGLDPGALGG